MAYLAARSSSTLESFPINTPVIEFSRAALVAGVLPTTTGHVYLAVDASICLLVGILIHHRLGPRAAEYV